MRHRAGRNALRVLRFRGDGGTARRPSLAQRASRTGISRWREQERMIGGCSLLCAQLHRHVAEKLCAESAYNHSVHAPLARGKNRSRKITKPLCGFVRHFVAKSGFIQLTRWEIRLNKRLTLWYSSTSMGWRDRSRKDEKNAREEQCPVKIEPDP